LKIISEPPKNWQELELIVAKLLNQCGYESERGKKIFTLRGTVDIDVFAQDNSSTPPSTYLIECKYWKSDIPKTVIHSFRTVVSDFGSHHGIIIAKEGFQSGAYEAAKNTNVLLLSWSEFLDLFEKGWLQHRIRNNHLIAKPLQIYIDPVDVSDFLKQLSNDELSNYKMLCNEYIKYSIYSHKLTFAEILSLPISHKEQIDNIIYTAEKEFDGYSFESYMDFFDNIEEKCLEGIKKFEKLFENTNALSHVRKYT
jgi:Restriction endonuclease